MIEKRQILFIINPISGTPINQYRKRRLVKQIDKIFKIDKYEYDISIKYTEYAHHATELATEAALKGYDTVVAVGGDGSINEIAQGLVNSNTSLGIIPLGSGNGLAHYMRIPLTINRALRLIKRNKTKLIDTVKTNDTIFVSIAGIGFDAHVAELYSKAKLRGLSSYFFIALTQYIQYIPKEYNILIDDKAISVDALLIGFGNSGQMGYNFSITPQSRINDGLIDVCIIKKPPLILSPIIGLLFWTRLLGKSRYVKTYKASQIKIIKKDISSLNVDGESISFDKTVDIKVNPKSLRIIIP